MPLNRNQEHIIGVQIKASALINKKLTVSCMRNNIKLKVKTLRIKAEVSINKKLNFSRMKNNIKLKIKIVKIKADALMTETFLLIQIKMKESLHATTCNALWNSKPRLIWNQGIRKSTKLLHGVLLF